MSVLRVISCDGCGAMYEGEITAADKAADWMAITGPWRVSERELSRWDRDDETLHVCSAVCLAALGHRLSEDDDAALPRGETSLDAP